MALPDIIKNPALILAVCTLASCQIPGDGTAPDTVSEVTPADTIPQSQTAAADIREGSTLTSELLYPLLVASIAAQRGQSEVALEALGEAAFASRNPELLTQATRLAMHLADYQQAIDFTRILSQLQPDNTHILIIRARALIRSDQQQSGLEILESTVRTASLEQTRIFREVAAALVNLHDKLNFQELVTGFAAGRESPGIAMTLSLVASGIKDYPAFIRWSDETLRLKPDWESAAALRIGHLLGREPESAKNFALAHLQKSPDHQQVRLQYARMLVEEDDFDGALAQLLQILDKDPEQRDALYIAGVIYLNKEDYPQAQPLLGKYLVLDPQNDQVRLYLAEIAEETGDLSAASRLLFAVNSPNHYLDAQFSIARIIAKRSNLQAGIRHLQQLSGNGESGQVRIILAQEALYRDYDEKASARQLLDRGLQRFPDNTDLLYNRGLLAAQMELLELHEQDMRHLIDLEPDNAHAYNALGYTLADKTDRLDEAMALISRANELLPDNPFILDSMGWVHFRLGNHDTAIKLLKEALDGRQDAEIAAHLGEVLWIEGEREEALKIWQLGQQWGPENEVLTETIERLTGAVPTGAAKTEDQPI